MSERRNRIWPLIRIAVNQEQIASMLGMSVRTVRDLSNRDDDPLPHFTAGVSGKRYPVREAIRWVKRQTAKV